MDEAGLVPDAERMADRLAIEEILALHCRGVDRADVIALKSCYWPDATTAYGTDAIQAHGFCEQLAKAITAYQQTHHMVTNNLIVFDGNSAKVESSVLAHHYLVNPDGEDTEMTYFGRYIDQFEKRGNIWKLAHREPVMSWSQNGAASHDPGHPALATLRKADRFPNDPIYQ